MGARAEVAPTSPPTALRHTEMQDTNMKTVFLNFHHQNNSGFLTIVIGMYAVHPLGNARTCIGIITRATV